MEARWFKDEVEWRKGEWRGRRGDETMMGVKEEMKVDATEVTKARPVSRFNHTYQTDPLLRVNRLNQCATDKGTHQSRDLTLVFLAPYPVSSGMLKEKHQRDRWTISFVDISKQGWTK